MRVIPTALALSAIAFPVSFVSAQSVAQETVQLDTIVVTGEKIGRDLQDTSTSVAVTTTERVGQENLQGLFQVLDRTANTSKTYGEAGFTIRGIADRDGEGAALSTIYLDGAALPADIVASGPGGFWDIGQIEVLRGPQSTIQGENALAGAIILRTEDPQMSWGGRVRAQINDADDTSLAAVVNLPLLTDELALRVSVEDRDLDGFVRNTTRGGYEDARHITTARAKLLWTPRALPALAVRLGFTSYDYEGPYHFTYSRVDVRDAFDNRRGTSDYDSLTDTQVDIVNLEVDYDLGGPWSLSSVTSWNDSSSHRRYDGDLTEQPQSHGNQWLEGERWSQELRLRFDGERLNGLLGAYWARRENTFQSSSLLNIETPTPTIAGLLMGAGFPADVATGIAGMYATVLPQVPVGYSSDTTSETRNAALFGDGEWRFTENLALLAGFRYDSQRFTMANDTGATFAGVFPDPDAFDAPGTLLNMAISAINMGVAGYVGQAAGASPQGTRDFDAFLPKLGLRYDFGEHANASATVQRGYRSGGAALNIARNLSVDYDPEYTWNYELALRTRWLDGALVVNANAFYVDWKDKQTSAYFGLNEFDTHVVNAGRAHLYGFELEASHRVSSGFDWYASLGHTHTQYDEFETMQDATVADYAGEEFVYAPRWTAAVGGNWRFGAGWVANLNANHRTSVYADIGQNRHELSSRTLVNGRFGYDHTHWGVHLFGENLFNEEYIEYRNMTQPLAIFGAPRVVGVSFEARW